MNQIHTLPQKEIHSKGIIGIQYLRGLAALMVVLCHVAEMANFPKYFSTNFLPTWLLSGSSGVHLFFVISGFIISHVSLNNRINPKISPMDFLTRRFIRIIPFMWVCIIGYASLRFLGRGTFTPLPYLRAAVLVPIGDIMPSQIWTLRHEVLFYLLFCVFILSVKPRWEILTLWFLSPVFWFWCGISDLVPASTFHQLCDFLFHKANLLFGMGFLIGVLYNYGFLNYTIKNWNGFILCAILTIPLFFFSYQRIMGNNFIIITGLFSTLIVIISIFLFSSRPLNRVDKFGLELGDASYSIYLVHPGIISAVLGVWSKFQPAANPFAVLVITCILSCIGGILVHKFIEKPIIKIARDRFEQKKIIADVSAS
ncbi:acyltransferase family protein [Larkinella terrae]|uniref:Acyltransferase family protein n=1 Tax=Larkinella terrae TaxID=2025311 RepID=A0A7K0EGE9_9BACT|nr:acyltransferase [Larkinella terrae]MRS60845.1 acyltransferase family protein [Larkinella terrae]